ncbi:MAG: radical SAM protein [archaeon]
MKTLSFVITSKCEEVCPYCFRTPQRDTSSTEFKGLLARAIRDYPELSKIVITGGNPELNPNFWDICKEVKAKGLRLKVHANYSTKKTWSKYVKLASEVSIPIDSLFTKQPFRSPESSANFRKAFDYFLKKKVPVQVHTVVGKPNLKDTLEIYDFLKSKGFFLPGPNSWKLFRLVGVNELKEQELTDKEWFEVKKRFDGRNVKFVDNVLEY